MNTLKGYLTSPKLNQKAGTLAGFAAGLPGPVTVPVVLRGPVFDGDIERVVHFGVEQLPHRQHLGGADKMDMVFAGLVGSSGSKGLWADGHAFT